MILTRKLHIIFLLMYPEIKIQQMIAPVAKPEGQPEGYSGVEAHWLAGFK